MESNEKEGRDDAEEKIRRMKWSKLFTMTVRREEQVEIQLTASRQIRFSVQYSRIVNK